jgi:hypothetical protein
MVGAASVIAVLNVSGEIELPFVFGGDGGTVVVPASLSAPASDALAALQAISESTFGLSLRIGAIPVRDLRAQGADLLVRKMELSPGNHLAMFAGGGAELADGLLKSAAPGSPYLIEAEAATGEPDLEGLSCRWEPLRARDGCMMTIMVQGKAADPGVEGRLLTEVLGAIREILGHPLGSAAPASARSMRFRWPPRGLALEARATAGRGNYLVRYLSILLESLIQYCCERFDRHAGPYNAPVYREELRANTDYRKYDGILRLVLEASREQAGHIERYLEEQCAAGRLVYGVHVAGSALMTCLVFSLEESRHLHFIDGADGGFAMAARGFKARLAERS